MDFPPSFARYPFVDPANESVDGDIVDKIEDNDLVSFFDLLRLSRRRGIFGLVRLCVLIEFVVRLVWRDRRELLELFVCLLIVIRVCCLLPVSNALFDAVDRIQKGE